MTRTLLATTAVALASPASADDVTKIAEVGWWGILHESDGAGSCSAKTVYTASTMRFFMAQVRNPQNHDETAWMLLFRNDKWKLKGKTVDAVIDVNDGTKYLKSMKLTFTVETNGTGMFAWVSKDVVNALAFETKKDAGFRLSMGNKEVGKFGLRDSAPAIRAVVNCLKDRPAGTTQVTTTHGPTERPWSYGTAFFVSKNVALTAYHVVDGCNTEIKVKYPGYAAVSAGTIATDRNNDLVLLKTDLPADGVASFRMRPRLGESVASFGFPYGSGFNTSGNFTLGGVTSTVGIGDDTTMLQFSAPVQPGNSGGPVLDMAGNVIGMSEKVMGTLKAADKMGGAVPQNVNFAVTGSMLVAFLHNNGLEPQVETSTKAKLDPEDLALVAKKFTVQVSCR